MEEAFSWGNHIYVDELKKIAEKLLLAIVASLVFKFASWFNPSRLWQMNCMNMHFFFIFFNWKVSNFMCIDDK